MIASLRVAQQLWDRTHADLSRPHPFAWERVGFLTCEVQRAPGNVQVLTAQTWHPVDDAHYIDDPTVGALVGPDGFRKMLQQIYNRPSALLHVHRHDHRGHPAFSSIDMRSMLAFVPGFFNACPTLPHGALVLSLDRCVGMLWPQAGARPVAIGHVEVLRP
jgi:hypothetical protein